MGRLMKDSGIPWIGEIPADWSIERMKSIFKESKEKSEDGKGTLLSLSQYTGIHFKSDSDRIFNGESLEGYNVVHSGQFVMNIMLAWNGSYAVSDYEGLISPAYAVFDFTRDAYKKYFHYLLRTPAYSGAFKTMSRGIIDSRLRLYPEYFYTFPVILPSISEQQKIADFLDRKCREVDELIALEEKMIEELKAYKQSVITETITKGLNPDVPMKDSGIEWIGQIPEHWGICKIQYLVDMRSGHNLTTEQIQPDGVYPVFGGNGIRGYYSRFEYDGNYVLVGRQGALCGNVNYANGKFWATEHAVVCHPRTQFNTIWFGEALRSMNLNQYSLSAAQPGLAIERIKTLPICLPTLDEQNQIANYLQKKCKEIDSLISIKQSKIAELQDYKKSIIYEYATGKKEVPTL